MQKIEYIARIIFSALIVLVTPIFYIIMIMGLTGADKKSFIIMSVGGLVVTIGNILSYFKKIGWGILFIGILIVLVGNYHSYKFWENENAKLCAELQANPTCKWTEEHISCDEFPIGSGGGFSVANMCQ